MKFSTLSINTENAVCWIMYLQKGIIEVHQRREHKEDGTLSVLNISYIYLGFCAAHFEKKAPTIEEEDGRLIVGGR